MQQCVITVDTTPAIHLDRIGSLYYEVGMDASTDNQCDTNPNDSFDWNAGLTSYLQDSVQLHFMA